MDEKKKKVTKIIAKLKELYPTAEIELNHTNALQLLVSTIMAAQCTDKLVNKVTETLFKKYKTVDDFANADYEELNKEMSSVTFHNNKAKNIIETAKIIKSKFGGKVPETMEELISLPGVARKTGNVVLGVWYKKPVGIVVDTHVRRLSNLLGLTDQQDPVKIEKDLMEIIPQKEWTDFSLRLILYGRRICTGRPHDHKDCALSNL